MRTYGTVASGLLLVLLILSPLVAFASSNSITVSVSPTTVTYNSPTFTVFGSVTAASSSVAGTGVYIRIVNPTGAPVAVVNTPVNGTGASGTFSCKFTAGGSTSWTSGTYTVTATYGTTSTTSTSLASATAKFTYLSAGVTATTTDTVTVSVSPTSVNGASVTASIFTVFGNVTAASGNAVGTSVFIKVVNPNGTNAAVGNAKVIGSGDSGKYYEKFTAGGSSAWISGTYTVTATYGTTSAAPASATVQFTYDNMQGFSDSTFTPTGYPTVSTVNGESTVAQTYTNTYGSPLQVYMWVDVMNSVGQTVGIYLGSATVGSGQQATIGAILFELSPGTYAAQLFVTTTSGIPVSGTSTTPSFVIGSATSSVSVAAVSVTAVHGAAGTLTAVCAAETTAPYVNVGLSNSGTAGTTATSVTITTGGVTETAALPAGCAIGPSESATATVTVGIELGVATVAGQQFNGDVTLANGAEVLFTGTFS